MLVTVKCAWCRKKKSIHPSKVGERNFCDRFCHAKYLADKTRGTHRDAVTVHCNNCGKELKRLPHDFRRHDFRSSARFYCDSKCRIEGRKLRVKVNCESCGRELTRKPSDLKKRPHSYCRHCRGVAIARGRWEHAKTVTCRRCGVIFKAYKPETAKDRLCPKCFNYLDSRAHYDYREKKIKICLGCGKKFEATCGTSGLRETVFHSIGCAKRFQAKHDQKWVDRLIKEKDQLKLKVEQLQIQVNEEHRLRLYAERRSKAKSVEIKRLKGEHDESRER